MSGHWYRAYGLSICSEVPLLVPPSERRDAADVTVRVGKVDASLPGVGNSRSLLRATPDEICSIWEPMGKVAVRGGREIVVEPHAGVGNDVIAPWIQGAALALVLHQRGFLVMHASAVAIDGMACAFIGEVGWGKSTTAAAMHARGHRLLADDVVAIRLNGEGIPEVVAGFPHLKITADAVKFMGEDPQALGRVVDDPQKLLRISRAAPPEAPVPLATVFVLCEGTTCAVEPLTPIAAMPELMQHAFVARLTQFLKLTNTEKTHFRNCTELIRHASVCRLRRPKSFELLDGLASLAEQHVMSRMACIKES